jgi:hypothetical protein
LVLALGALTWYFSKRGCLLQALPYLRTPLKRSLLPNPRLLRSRQELRGRLDTTTGNYIYDRGNEVELKLADGTVLKVGEISTEAQLFNLLSSASFTIDTVDKTKNWISPHLF